MSYEQVSTSRAALSEKQRVSEWLTPAVVALTTAVSVVLLLTLTSPEFSWDEADLLRNRSLGLGDLWSRADYVRHYHGPLELYLAKLAAVVIPAGFGPVEGRLRFFIALVSSTGVGLLYWILRAVFQTSRAAALVGTSLLLLSFIRLEETNLIGPHHLILVCTLGFLALGYHFRNTASRRTALWLGCVLAYGAVTMTYVIPIALCVLAALAVVGSRWIRWDPPDLRISGWVSVVVATGALGLLILWPPGVVRLRLAKDFAAYLTFTHHPTLIGDTIFEVTPRSAVLHWLLGLDAPILVVSVAVIVAALWRALKARCLSSRERYFGVCLAFFLGTSLSAHICGPRNILQLVGVMCLASGALFDQALGHRPRLARASAAVIIALAVTNLVRLTQSPSYRPYLATGGYRAFVEQDASRLREKATAVVYGSAILDYYAGQAGVAPGWNVMELPWTTNWWIKLPPDTKYVLIPEFIYEYMPPEHPMRKIVADQWKVVWSSKRAHVWDLRLFERPAGGPALFDPATYNPPPETYKPPGS